MKLKSSHLRSLLSWGLIALMVYFGNIQLQSWMGRRALASTGLEVHQFEPGLQLAASSDRLVFADMSAIWCSSCRAFDKKVLADPSVRQAITEDFVFVRMEYEDEDGKAFRERYDVSGFPVFLVLDAEGDLISRIPLTYDSKIFLNLLRQARTHGAASVRGAR